MKRLAITADDFGLTDGVCLGILEALDRGVVSSTSAMVAFPGAVDRVARHGSPALAGRLGLHVQLTAGRSCAPPSTVPSLVDGAGRFASSVRELGALDANDVDRELRAQVRRLREVGLDPAHLDSHHHVHHRADVVGTFAGLARTLGIAARSGPPPVRLALASAGGRHADRFASDWFGGRLTVDRLVDVVRRAFDAIGGNGTVELMTHPGHMDEALGGASRYAEDRERELAVVCAPDLKRRLADLEVEIVPHAGL